MTGPLATKWTGLLAASAGLFLGSLDITVNVALPDITRSFETDLQTVQWIIISYVGTTAGLQLSLGTVVDMYGLRRLYVIGLATYTVAVMLIGVSPLLPMVFGLRMVQALGNGLIMASAPALVTRAFPSEERGRALGLMVGLGTLGMITGSLGGGVLVDAFGWRAIFIGRLPVGLAAIVLALAALREVPSDDAKSTFDLWGALSLFVGLGALILALTIGGRIGWTDPVVPALMLLSAVSLSAFAYLERTAARPVLDMALLRHRVLSPAVLSAYLMSLAMFVNWFILPFYVSNVLGLGAKSLGLLLALTPAVGALSAPVGGWLSDRVAPAYVTTLALVLGSGSMFWFSLLGVDSTATDVALAMGATGIGMGLFQGSNASLIMGSVPRNMLGTGGAVMALSRSLGAVSSVAIMGAVFAARLDSHAMSLGVDSASAPAFVMAFKDTYRLSSLLVLSAALVSLIYWPQLLRRATAAR